MVHFLQQYLINRSTKLPLDNDGFGVVMPFDTQDSKLFKGNSTVTDGFLNSILLFLKISK